MVPAQAAPPLPHAFYGDVTIDGAAVPLGTLISAKVNGVESGSVVTWELGKYGWGLGIPNYEYQGNLLVQGYHISNGDLIEFYINNVKADQTAIFYSGELTELDLTVASVPLAHTWRFCAPGFFPKHLPDSFGGQVVLVDLDLGTIPDYVQGVYWFDCTGMGWQFWAPGAPGCTLSTLGGGHTYDYMVAVTGDCDWEVPLSSGTPTPAPVVGAWAPDFTASTLDGETIILNELRGQPVILNFWATWCGYSRYQMPFLQAAFEEKGHEMEFIGINIRENSEKVRQVIAYEGIDYTIVLDSDGAVANSYNVGPIPATFFIDEQGVIKEIKIGAFMSQSELMTVLENLYSPPPNSGVLILWSEIITEIDDAVPGTSIDLVTITQQEPKIIITGTATEDSYIWNFATNLEEKENFWDVRVTSIVSSGEESSFSISSQLNGISLEQYVVGRVIPYEINTLELVDHIIDVMKKAEIGTYTWSPGGTGTVIIGGATYHTHSSSISITSAERLTTLINLQSYIEEPPTYGTLNNVGVVVDDVNLSYFGSEQWKMDFKIGVITE